MIIRLHIYIFIFIGTNLYICCLHYSKFPGVAVDKLSLFHITENVIKVSDILSNNKRLYSDQKSVQKQI